MPNIISHPGQILGNRLNLNAKRPFFDKNGVPSIIQNGQKLQTNDALLRYDEWKDLDRSVIQIATDRLVAVADLQSMGLVHNLGSIGQTITQWEELSDMTSANISMSGISRGEKDSANFDNAAVPVPIVHKDFEINLRRLEASRIFGESLDVTQAAIAARKVAEASEDMLFAGNSIQVNGETIYGYTTHPQRNTHSLGTAWDAESDNANILADVIAMMDKARADGYYGPYNLYIPSDYEGVMDEDFQAGSGDIRTVRQRLLQLNGLNAIKVADRLADNNVVLVQMTRDVVDLAVAQDITTVQWDEQGGMVAQFKVMAVWVPRVKNDFDGNSGIVHAS